MEIDNCQRARGEGSMVRMTEELQWVLTKYPRGYHSVSNADMYLILDAYEYQMESPGGISGAFGISRETLRVWGIKNIIHYFVRRDKIFRILEAYIPLITFIDAPLPNTERYKEEVENVKKTLEKMELRRESYYRERLRAEKSDKNKNIKETIYHQKH
jgi:hypothetical protein